MSAPSTVSCLESTPTSSAIERPRSIPDNAPPRQRSNLFKQYRGLHGGKIKMARVDPGSVSFRDVDLVAPHPPQVTGFDVILVQSLLKFMKLEFDCSVGRLRIEELRKKSVEP